jgi:exosome complex RNA-binding protein Csl4
MPPRLGNVHLRGSVRLDLTPQERGNVSGRLRGVGRFVVDIEPALAEVVAKVPHRREAEGEALLMLRVSASVNVRLRHGDGVLGRVRVVQDRGVAVELIAKDEDQSSHGDAQGGD